MRAPRFSFAIVALFLVGCGAAQKEPQASARPPLKDPTLLIERGQAFSAVGDYTRAEQYFAAALAAGAKSQEVLPHLLKACVASGDLRLASEYAETELSRNPENARLRFLTGALYASIGNRTVARKHLEKAATDLPKDPEVQFAVAAFFRDDLQDRVGGDAYFREYLKLAPKGEHASEAKASLMERLQ
jgi:tetratricopeptide (TPR) repeat protein